MRFNVFKKFIFERFLLILIICTVYSVNEKIFIQIFLIIFNNLGNIRLQFILNIMLGLDYLNKWIQIINRVNWDKLTVASTSLARLECSFKSLAIFILIQLFILKANTSASFLPNFYCFPLVFRFITFLFKDWITILYFWNGVTLYLNVLIIF